MFGSLSDFISVDMSLVQSRLVSEENQEDKGSTFDQINTKRTAFNYKQYRPSDKSHLLARFNLRNPLHQKNTSFLPQTNNRSQIQRKSLVAHTSFFAKNQITKDYIAKSQLKRRHNLLRAIVRNNQNDSLIEGVSDYDQSFKRMYEKFQSVHSKPILEYRNLVVDESFTQMPSHHNVQVTQKHVSSLSHKKRIEYENCLNWAKKHKKKSQFYQQQLGKHLKQKKQLNLNLGHSLMPEVQRKLRTLINKLE